MIAGRVKERGVVGRDMSRTVESIIEKDYSNRLVDGEIAPTRFSEPDLPFRSPFFRFKMKLPPASGADVMPEGSATLISASVDLSRTKEGVPDGLLPWL